MTSVTMLNYQPINYQPAQISTQCQLIRDNIRMVIQKGTGGAKILYEASDQNAKIVEIGFNLGGPIKSVLYTPHQSQAKQSDHGQAHIAFHPSCSSIVEYSNNQPVCYFSFVISIDLFEHLFDMSIDAVKDQMYSRDALCYALFSPITADMKLALHQMMFCSFSGKTRGLFIEGKVMELVSYLRQATNDKSGVKLRISLTAEDQKKMWQAKSILDESLESPPSILDLAKRIGVNEFKLKNGFRQVHGITPYRYLADQRLEKARHLLREKEMNVSEAAFAVGYSSLSHFAKIFRTKYGITPHEYMAG